MSLHLSALNLRTSAGQTFPAEPEPDEFWPKFRVLEFAGPLAVRVQKILIQAISNFVVVRPQRFGFIRSRPVQLVVLWFGPKNSVIGYLCAALSMVVAGFFEIHRKNFSQVEQTLSGKVLKVSSMPCFQLAPQYILLGLAEALVTPACSVITFRLVPGRMRGIAMHFLTLFNGAGCFIGAFIIQTSYMASGGGWFPGFLADGNLERFFFFLASLMILNTLGFWRISHRYSNLDLEIDPGPRGSLLEEKLLQHEKSLKFYESILEYSPKFSSFQTVL